MFKSSPKPPPAPDPREIVGAQGEANVQSAIASALLNQQNTVGPEGTTSFAQTGGQNVGGQFVPSFTRTTELTPEGQAQFEAQQQLGSSLTGLAQGQVGRIEGAFGQGIDTSVLPGLSGAAQAGPIQGNLGFSQPIQGDLGFSQPIQDDLGFSQSIQGDLGFSQPIQGDLGFQGDIQQGLDTSGLPQVRQDFAEQGRELEQATFDRGLGLLDPGFARERQAAELQLTERGLPLGSESAAGILDPVAERQNAARRQLALASIGAGRNEQARLFGQQSQLRGQQFGELGFQGQFGNQAQQQGFGQALLRQQTGNQAQQQGFGQALVGGQFGNQAQQQGFGQALTRQQTGAQAQQQGFGQALTRQQIGAQAQQQGFGQALTRQQIVNQAQQQGFGQALTRQQIGAQAQQQGFGQALAGGQFGNQAQALAFNQNQASAAQNNAARGQGFQEQAFQRALPINDIAALLGTAPGVQQPQFQATPAFGVQAPDVIGANLGTANIAAQNFATQQAGRSGLLGGLFGLGSSLIENPGIFSDRRLKSNIRPYGKTSKGFNLYKYIIGGIEEIGVMAQEVMKTLPDAVVIRDGYYAVNYDMVN